MLSEEIFDHSKNQLTQQQIQELKQQMNEDFTTIFELCKFVLQNAHVPMVPRHADILEVVELLEAACRQSEAILAGPKCEEEVVTGVDRGVITRKGPCGAPAKHKGDNDILLCARCAEHAFVASELPLPEIGS
jgi:hypothetical protein